MSVHVPPSIKSSLFFFRALGVSAVPIRSFPFFLGVSAVPIQSFLLSLGALCVLAAKKTG